MAQFVARAAVERHAALVFYFCLLAAVKRCAVVLMQQAQRLNAERLCKLYQISWRVPRVVPIRVAVSLSTLVKPTRNIRPGDVCSCPVPLRYGTQAYSGEFAKGVLLRRRCAVERRGTRPPPMNRRRAVFPRQGATRRSSTIKLPKTKLHDATDLRLLGRRLASKAGGRPRRGVDG